MAKEEDNEVGKDQSGAKPKNPMPKQKQPRPGIEKKVTPRPQYKAPTYKGSGKLKGMAAIITGGDSGSGEPSQFYLHAKERTSR
jgi:hypothetical protein